MKRIDLWTDTSDDAEKLLRDLAEENFAEGEDYEALYEGAYVVAGVRLMTDAARSYAFEIGAFAL